MSYQRRNKKQLALNALSESKMHHRIKAQIKRDFVGEVIIKKTKSHGSSKTSLSTSKRKGIINKHNNLYDCTIHNCIYCGCDIDSTDNDNYTLDHLVPQYHGGNNRDINLRPCCKKCNNEKDRHMIDDWLVILNEDFQNSGANDVYKLYRYMRVLDVKRYVDRMGDNLYK